MYKKPFRFALLLVLVALVFTSAPTARADAPEVKFYLNGLEYNLGDAVILDGTTYIPWDEALALHFVFADFDVLYICYYAESRILEYQGVYVDWIPDSFLTEPPPSNGEVRTFISGSAAAFADVTGKAVTAILVDDIPYIPLRGISEYFDLEVEWNQEEYAVYITGTPAANYHYDYYNESPLILSRVDFTLTQIGESYTLTASLDAGEAVEVEWYSNNIEVATVDENGTVTAQGLGITTIVATAGEYTAECIVRVVDFGSNNIN